MARVISQASDADYIKAWKRFSENYSRATPVDLSESVAEKAKRIRTLETEPEAWFKYYFPMYCSAEPAEFQKKSSRIVLSTPELYIVRAWARELAKSTRSMMEDIYQAMTGQITN